MPWRSRRWTRLVLTAAMSCLVGGLSGCYYYHHSYGGGYPRQGEEGHSYGHSRSDRGRHGEGGAAYEESESRESAYRAPEPPPPPTKRRRRSPEG